MSQSMKERQIDEVIKDLANSSKAEELNKSTWGRGKFPPGSPFRL